MRLGWAAWFAAVTPLAVFAPNGALAWLVVAGALGTTAVAPQGIRRRIFPLWTTVAALAIVAALATFGLPF